MTTTLTYASTALTLPDDLLWPDEYAWQAVEQRAQYTITGALLVESAAKQAGRPLTLQGGGNWAWLDRTTLETLRAWAALPAQTFSLLFRGVTYSVVFDQPNGAISATPVVDYSDPTTTDYYVVTLRFIEV
jgi:hypothetical protein